MTDDDKQNLKRGIRAVIDAEPDSWAAAMKIIGDTLGVEGSAKFVSYTLFDVLSNLTIADLAAMIQKGNQ
jgi:hypothetical protein